MRERKDGPKDKITLPYLSYAYQRSGLERLGKVFQEELQFYMETKGVAKKDPKDINIDITKKDLTKAELAEFVVGELHRAKQSFLDLLKIEEKKPQDQRKGENNTLLKNYLNNIKNSLAAGKWLLAEKIKRDPKRLKKAFVTLEEVTQQQINYLDRAIDTQIFIVKMPTKDYLKMKAESGIVHYEGRPMVAGKTVGGGLLTLGAGAALVAEIVFFPIAIADIAIAQGMGMRALAQGVKIGAEATKSGVARYGRHCKQDIPPEYFVAQANVDIKANTVAQVGERKLPTSTELTTFFVVDARDPSDVFKFGTNYHLGIEGINNPHGHVIFFENPIDAARFIQERGSNMDYYDPQAGWRLHNKWQELERRQVHDSLAQVATAATAARPTPSVPNAEPGVTLEEPLPTAKKI